jgi:hypothetical protein
MNLTLSMYGLGSGAWDPSSEAVFGVAKGTLETNFGVTLHTLYLTNNVMVLLDHVLPGLVALRKVLLTLQRRTHLQIHYFVSCDAHCGTVQLHTAIV